MCDFCERKPFNDEVEIDITERYFFDDNFIIHIMPLSSFGDFKTELWRLKMNYCPKCGKKLGE